MSEINLSKFSDLVCDFTGIKLRVEDKQSLAEKIKARLKKTQVNNVDEYCELLRANTIESQLEWQSLLQLITNVESYFFRDQGQFQLLKNTLLPELIEKKKTTKNLRILSAGCSTGEEPYSLAILLKELVIDLESWNLVILGIDINPEALLKAKKAIYTPWSFRLVNSAIKNKYFSVALNQYDHFLTENIKSYVSFKQVNLVKDSWEKEMERFDLIICRNVFIYFETSAIATVLEKFYDALQPTGYLLTGHAELSGQNLNHFQGKVFPDSIVYQPRNQTNFAPSLPIEMVKQNSYVEKNNLSQHNQGYLKLTKTPITQPTEEELIKQADNLISQKAYNLALSKLGIVLKHSPLNYQANLLSAKVYGDQGNHDQAIAFAKKCLTIKAFALEPNYILAQIAQEQNQIEEAKRLYKQIIYLDPSSLRAHLELKHIYEQEGDEIRGKKMRLIALELVQSLTAEQLLAETDGTTIQEIKQNLE